MEIPQRKRDWSVISSGVVTNRFIVKASLLRAAMSVVQRIDTEWDNLVEEHRKKGVLGNAVDVTRVLVVLRSENVSTINAAEVRSYMRRVLRDAKVVAFGGGAKPSTNGGVSRDDAPWFVASRPELCAMAAAFLTHSARFKADWLKKMEVLIVARLYAHKRRNLTAMGVRPSLVWLFSCVCPPPPPL